MSAPLPNPAQSPTLLDATTAPQLLDIGPGMATATDARQLCQLLIEQAQPLLGFADCGLFVPDEEGHYRSHLLPPQTASALPPALFGAPAVTAHSFGTRWEVAAGLRQFPTDAGLIALQQAGMQYIIALPLRAEDAPIGVLLLFFRREEPRAAADFSLYAALARQLTLVLANALLREQNAARERETSLRQSLQQALTAETSWEARFAGVTQALHPLVAWDICYVSVPRKPGLQLLWRHQSASDEFERLPLDELQRPELSPLALRRLMQHGVAAQEAPASYGGPEFLALAARHGFVQLLQAQYQVASQLYLPVWSKGEKVAVLHLFSRQAAAYQVRHLELLQRLAPDLAWALASVFAQEEIQQRTQEGTQQLALHAALARQPEPSRLYPTVARELNQLVRFSRFSAWIYSADKLLDYGCYARTGTDFAEQTEQTQNHLGASDAVLRELWRSPAEPVCLTGEACAQWLAASQLPFEQPIIASRLLLPLPLQSAGLRALLVLDSQLPYAFTAADARTLQLFVPQLALAIDNRLAHEEIRRLKQRVGPEAAYFVEEAEPVYAFEEIVGTSPLLQCVFRQIEQVAPTDATVLVLGESGTGKELVAQALHARSQRREQRLVKVNCAALPAQLIESELFGHEKGAFTGALDRRIGKFELAHGGTIFLDEIGELPLELQAKLLRVLQEREIERLGGKGTIPVSIRVVAATNRNLEDEVAAGRFRADLYYRLNVFPVQLPALRERREDIPALATHFARHFARQLKKPYQGIKARALQELLGYDWPGNIRELANLIEQAAIVCSGSLEWSRKLPATLPRPVLQPKEPVRLVSSAVALKDDLANIERSRIATALAQAGGRIRGTDGAAALLRMKPTTLEARMRKLGIHKEYKVPAFQAA